MSATLSATSFVHRGSCKCRVRTKPTGFTAIGNRSHARDFNHRLALVKKPRIRLDCKISFPVPFVSGYPDYAGGPLSGALAQDPHRGRLKMHTSLLKAKKLEAYWPAGSHAGVPVVFDLPRARRGQRL